MAQKKLAKPSPACGAPFVPTGWGTSPSLRWCENPAACGLRLVGTAHDLAPRGVRHTGWYTDSFQDGKAWGLVFRLGKSRGFVAGVATSNDSDGSAVLELEIWGDETDAALRADKLAEIYAESERDYSDAWQAGQRAREHLETARELTRGILELLRDARPYRRSDNPPARLCARLAQDVRAMLRDRAEARDQAAQLEKDCASTFRDAFAEGRGF
jgi:hypothetical protein